MNKKSSSGRPAASPSGAAGEKGPVNKASTTKERIKRIEELGIELAEEDDECGFIVMAQRPHRKS
jgi:hypothetical protein